MLYLFQETNNLYKIFYNDYMVEIMGGVFLSFIGLCLVWFLRPKVKISTKIARVENNGKIEYQFKVRNRSKLFKLVDVHFELTFLKPVTSPNGMNLAIKKVNLKSNKIWFLNTLPWIWQKNVYGTYAIVLTVDEDYDLIDKWREGNGIFLDLKVIAKNNFSGITSIIHQKYDHSSCVTNGYFKHGKELDIEPV